MVAGVALVATGDVPTATRLGVSMTALQASIGALNDLVEEQTIDGGFYFVGDWVAIQELADNLPDDPNGRNALEPGVDPTDGQGE